MDRPRSDRDPLRAPTVGRHARRCACWQRRRKRTPATSGSTSRGSPDVPNNARPASCSSVHWRVLTNGCGRRPVRRRCGTRGSCRRPVAGCIGRAVRTAGSARSCTACHSGRMHVAVHEQVGVVAFHSDRLEAALQQRVVGRKRTGHLQVLPDSRTNRCYERKI